MNGTTTLLQFLNDPEWDAPVFKRLANNDTGAAKGKQAGMVLPKDLRPFLPSLDASLADRDAPTVDRRLSCELYLADIWIGSASVRYQFQTWGGKRSPESRLTDGTKQILSIAVGGDILILQRRIDMLDSFRMVLVKQDTDSWAELAALIGDRNWGVLSAETVPVSQTELDKATEQIRDLAKKPFETQTTAVKRKITTYARIARSVAFKEAVRREYRSTCAVSSIKLRTPTDLVEVQAAHVVPLNSMGSDDIRNGLALTSTLHWAFDHGLFGVVPRKRTVYIPKQIADRKSCAFLHAFAGRKILEAHTGHFRVHDDALDWHLQNIAKRWD